MEKRTLLLSANYMPIRVIRWEDAVKLRYEGTADVLVEYEEEICSPSVIWKWPAVMRLRRLESRKRSRVVRFSRTGVYLRDKMRCMYCGKKFTYDALSIDHVTPRSRGGQTTWQNCVASCLRCNSEKGSKNCAQWGHWPINEPTVPKYLPDQGPRIDVRNAPEEWNGYYATE